MVNEEAYAQALQDLANNVFPSLRSAAEAHGIQHTTLARRRRGQLGHSRAHQEQQLLSPTQEGLLVKWVLEAEVAGQRFNHAQLTELASLISRSAGGQGVVGKHWILRFLKRHPDIQTKTRAEMVSQRAALRGGS